MALENIIIKTWRQKSEPANPKNGEIILFFGVELNATEDPI